MNDRLVWVDCEMTGLNVRTDKLIEIAALVTDSDLNILGDGIDVVIHAYDEALAAMPEVVVAMHAKSGLTERVRESTVTLEQAEQLVLAYVREHVPEAEHRAAGRQFDRHRPRLHQPGHADAGRASALPDDRRLQHQGALPALVPADLLRPAAEGDDAPGA